LEIVEEGFDHAAGRVEELELEGVRPFLEAVDVVGAPGCEEPLVGAVDGEADLVDDLGELGVG